MAMDWRERIISNPKIAGGKPIIAGTRLSVEFILSLLSRGWSEAYILEQYPHLKKEDFSALYSFLHHWYAEDLRLMPNPIIKAA